MRIAQVAPLFESVPPQKYGGTERVVSYLTEELVHQGHEVTLFASGDSLTSARLVPACERSLRPEGRCTDAMSYHLPMLEAVFREKDRFDIIHFHVDYLHYPLSRRERHVHITTLHGRLDLPELANLYHEYAEMPVVSISDAQRQPLPWLNWQGTVYHGIPDKLYTFREQPGSYLAFLGRIAREKRPDRAIEIARRTGFQLKIAAKVDKSDRDYFEQEIKPLLREPRVEFVGEVGGRAKEDFLGNAYALLFPVDWPEPFGLVMVESMACGTPVIAWPNGSVPEVMVDGVTGFIVDNVEDAAQAVARISGIDRHGCRTVVQNRFSARRMARDYLDLYHRLLKKDAAAPVDRVHGAAGLRPRRGSARVG